MKDETTPGNAIGGCIVFTIAGVAVLLVTATLLGLFIKVVLWAAT